MPTSYINKAQYKALRSSVRALKNELDFDDRTYPAVKRAIAHAEVFLDKAGVAISQESKKHKLPKKRWHY